MHRQLTLPVTEAFLAQIRSLQDMSGAKAIVPVLQEALRLYEWVLRSRLTTTKLYRLVDGEYVEVRLFEEELKLEETPRHPYLRLVRRRDD